MNSLRMCMVCREMKPKDELIRAVRVKGEPAKIDDTYKAQGRGAYVCKSVECASQAQKRKIFERAFSCRVEDKLYEDVMNISEDLQGRA